MTQQFKFGDRVIYKFRHCIVIKTSDNFAYIMGEDRGYTVPINELELTPHPDTARLDWLADPANKIGKVILPTECVDQHPDSLRDAIDAAMRIAAAETA